MFSTASSVILREDGAGDARRETEAHRKDLGSTRRRSCTRGGPPRGREGLSEAPLIRRSLPLKNKGAIRAGWVQRRAET